PIKEEKPDIYQALKLANAQLGKGPFRAGDTLTFSYELANTSKGALTIPEEKGGKRGEHSAGVRQSWIERLGDDPTIPLKGRRQGRKYAVGADTFLVDAVVPAGKMYRYTAIVKTEGFTAGVYRYSIDLKK